MTPENVTRFPAPVIEKLAGLLKLHEDKRVIVVGGTCIGKTTILSCIPGARDQDAEVFPKLTKSESDYVCQVPWTEEIGRTMTKFVRERVIAEVGRPVFGTVVIDCDLIILLSVSDQLLMKRAAMRNVAFSDAKNMHLRIRHDVESAGVPWVEYRVG